MTWVRKHERQTASGKVTTVRQHERSGPEGARMRWSDRVARARAGLPYEPEPPDYSWWDRPEKEEEMPASEHPEGTWFFRDHDGDLYAVHPDGTTHLVGGDEPDQASGDMYEFHEGATIRRSGPDGKTAEWAVPPQSGDLPAAPQRPAGEAFEQMAQEMRDWRARGEPPRQPWEEIDAGKARLLGTDTPQGRDKYERLAAYRSAGYTGPLDQDNHIPDPDDPANWEWMSAGAHMRSLRGQPIRDGRPVENGEPD